MEVIQTERLDPSFVKKLSIIKYQLYESIVFRPNLNSEQAHDNAILNEYLEKVNVLYQMSNAIQNGNDPYEILKRVESFPLALQPSIRNIMQWIIDFFQKNGPVKTIPYTHYIENTFRVYPFVHTHSLHTEDMQVSDDEDKMNTV